MDEEILDPEVEEPTTDPTEEEPSEDESILKTVRKMIGPSGTYDVFDTNLIININAAFSRLCQLGVGPATPYKITGVNETWSDFWSGADDEVDMPDEVRQYVALKTQLVFDTPASSNVTKIIQEQIDMLEWTLREIVEIGY